MASKDSARDRGTPARGRQSAPEISDELLAAAGRGDAEARRELYETCHRQVYRLMVRMVGIQDAADVAQQVFLQLFRKLEQFSGRSSFRTWLYRLAVNEALQYLRKERRWSFAELAREPVGQAAGMVAERQARQELLETALARIDPDQRALFLLREIDGLSYREIAGAVGIPEGTVGSRLNRVRRELRELLIQMGWEE